MNRCYDYPAEVSGCVQERLADDAPDPTAFRQFAVQVPGGGEPKQYGDRSYVQYGEVLRDSAPGSVLVERDVTVIYGPWRPIGTAPKQEPDDADMVEVDLADRRDGDFIVITGRLQNRGHEHLRTWIWAEFGTTEWANSHEGMALADPKITVRRHAVPLPTNEGAVIRCLIHGLDGPRVAELEDGTWLTTGIDHSYGGGQIARVLAVLDEGKSQS